MQGLDNQLAQELDQDLAEKSVRELAQETVQELVFQLGYPLGMEQDRMILPEIHSTPAWSWHNRQAQMAQQGDIRSHRNMVGRGIYPRGSLLMQIIITFANNTYPMYNPLVNVQTGSRRDGKLLK